MPMDDAEAILAHERKKKRDRERHQWKSVYAAYLRLLDQRGVVAVDGAGPTPVAPEGTGLVAEEGSRDRSAG